MKKIIVPGFIFLLAYPLYAGNDRLEIRGAEAEELYNELLVKEKEAPKDPDQPDRSLFLKTLPGLLCTKDVIFRARNKVHCTLDENLNQEQLRVIYDMLRSDLEEMQQPIPVGATTFFKKLRAFTLKKSIVISPEHPTRYELLIPNSRATVTVKDRSARDIYRALDVESVRETDIDIKTEIQKIRKGAGPLTCSETTLVPSPGGDRDGMIRYLSLYLCELLGEKTLGHDGEKIVSVMGENARVIYEALRVKEKEERDPVPMFVKHVGTLQCSRSFLRIESFFCTLEGE